MKVTVLAALAAMLAVLTLAAGPAVGSGAPAPKCASGAPATKVRTGIVEIIGCFGMDIRDGEVYVTASPGAQPLYGSGDRAVRAIDMNGFLVDGRSRGSGEQGTIMIGVKGGSIRNVGKDKSTSLPVQLYTINRSANGQPWPLGGPFVLNFTAPKTGSVLLEDLRLGADNPWGKAIAGFSPATDLEIPVRLLEDGKGSMDITLRLTGIFALKGRPQSATIKVPSAVGEGSSVDGFTLKLEKIDGIKLIEIRSLEAEYSASQKKFAGGADFSLPIMNKKGVSFAFEIEDGVLRKVSIGASGLKIPLGTPPAGLLTAINGGFGFNPVGGGFMPSLNAGVSTEFGPEVPTPWGKVVPIEANASLDLGKNSKEFYFVLEGGLKVFRLPVGKAYVRIFTSTGVELGFSIGVGFPSYANNPNDPFYIGAAVNGWAASKKVQFEGSGRVRLFGLNLFDGRVLINQKVVGACWGVLWFEAGAAYELGSRSVKTFGTTCGLGRYRERFPTSLSAGGVVASARHPRRFSTGAREVIASVRGQGDAPRFTLTAPDGRRISVPRTTNAIRTRDMMIVVDRKNRVTHVAAGALARGRWTITPYTGSAPVTGVKTGRVLPAERVRAEVRGRGLDRTLVWDSTGNPRTKLTFTELMADGSEKPIVVTDRARGRQRFRAAHGGDYGRRRLKAYVIHGGTPREVTIEDRFTVWRPARLRASRRVRAWRTGYSAGMAWRGVPGARGYVAQIAIRRNGRAVSAYRREVGPKRHRIRIPSYPGGSRAVATVQALNVDGVPGRAASTRFRLSPPDGLSLKQAGRRSAAAAVRRGGKMRVRAICPINGHCQTTVLLKLGRRTVGKRRFQQAPDTYRYVLIPPRSRALRRRLARGRLKRLRVVLRQHRVGGRPVITIIK